MTGDLFGFNVTAKHGAKLVAQLRGDLTTPHDDAARAAHVDVLDRLEPEPAEYIPLPTAPRDTVRWQSPAETVPELGEFVEGALGAYDALLCGTFVAAAGASSAQEVADLWREAEHRLGLALALAVAAYTAEVPDPRERSRLADLLSHTRTFLVNLRHGARRIVSTVHEIRGWSEPAGLDRLPRRT